MVYVKRSSRVLFWSDDRGRVFKAVTNKTDGVVRIYNENDQLVLKRSGLTAFQVRNIEFQIEKEHNIRKKKFKKESFKSL